MFLLLRLCHLFAIVKTVQFFIFYLVVGSIADFKQQYVIVYVLEKSVLKLHIPMSLEFLNKQD